HVTYVLESSRRLSGHEKQIFFHHRSAICLYPGGPAKHGWLVGFAVVHMNVLDMQAVAKSHRSALRPRPSLAPHPATPSAKLLLPVTIRFCSSGGDADQAKRNQVLEEVLRQHLAEGLPGTREEEAYALAYTCGVCDGRSVKKISKRAYHQGVVIVTCPHCENRHLIADRLGWFEDESTDIEKMMKEKGEEIVKLGKYRLNCAPEDAQKALEELVHVEAKAE
ncbi:unnamed protein product, partial [Effrenium voratum]